MVSGTKGEKNNNQKNYFKQKNNFEFYMPTPGWQMCLPPMLVAGPGTGTLGLALQQTPKESSSPWLCPSQLAHRPLKAGQSWRARGRLDRARTWFLPWTEMGGLEIHISSPRVVGQYERHASPSPIQSYRSRGLGPVIVFCFTQFPLTFPTTDPEVKQISHLTTTGP